MNVYIVISVFPQRSTVQLLFSTLTCTLVLLGLSFHPKWRGRWSRTPCRLKSSVPVNINERKDVSVSCMKICPLRTSRTLIHSCLGSLTRRQMWCRTTWRFSIWWGWQVRTVIWQCHRCYFERFSPHSLFFHHHLWSNKETESLRVNVCLTDTPTSLNVHYICCAYWNVECALILLLCCV